MVKIDLRGPFRPFLPVQYLFLFELVLHHFLDTDFIQILLCLNLQMQGRGIKNKKYFEDFLAPHPSMVPTLV